MISFLFERKYFNLNPVFAKPNNMNEAFKTRLAEATFDEIPQLLEILQQHYKQIPSKGMFNQLRKEFIDQPNNFSLSGWRGRLLTFVGGFKFHIELPDDPENNNPGSSTVTQHHTGSGDNVAGNKIIFGEQSAEKNTSKKRKILFLSANPTDADRLQIDREYSRIQKRLESSSQRDTFELLNPRLSVTIQDLIKAMNQEPEIVHFSGHGEEVGILIANDQNEAQLMPVRVIKRLFRQHQEHTRLVILNACYSAEQAKAISIFGIHVIGMNQVADDNATIDFAEGLYNGLGEGKTVELAFDDAMMIVDTNYPHAALHPEIWHEGKQLEL